MLLRFSDIEGVLQIVRYISNSFLRPESMELIDTQAAQSLEDELGFKLQKDELLLLVGTAGSREEVERHIAEFRALAEANNAQNFSVLSRAEEKKTWASQRRTRLHLAPGMIKGKAVVPIHKIGDMFQEIKKAAAGYRLQVGITGHVGSGILYPGFLPEEHNAQNNEMMSTIAELVQSADKLGGFFLVESGPPEIRQAYDLVSQRSDYELMRRLKRSFDPKNIFNPGKIVRTL